MVLQTAKGKGCCEGRCCCPTLVTSTLFLYPDKEQGQVVSTVSPDAHQVEDVSDDKDEELRELMSPLRK